VRQPTLPKISQSYFVAQRIDAAQRFNCEKWRKTKLLWQVRQQKVSANVEHPVTKIKDRDTTTLKVLQIETIKTTTFPPGIL
jgi:hypothetical protein